MEDTGYKRSENEKTDTEEAKLSISLDEKSVLEEAQYGIREATRSQLRVRHPHLYCKPYEQEQYSLNTIVGLIEEILQAKQINLDKMLGIYTLTFSKPRKQNS